MIRILIVITLSLIFVNTFGQDGYSYTNIKYDSIVLFDFESRGESKEELSIINDDNKLALLHKAA